MWPHSGRAEKWFPPLDKLCTPVCPRFYLASLSLLPCLLAQVGFGVFDLTPAPSFLSPLISTPVQQKPPPVKPGRLSTCPCLSLAPGLYQAVLSAWNGFPHIAAQYVSHPTGRAWVTECKVLEKHSIWSQCRDVTLSPNLNVVGLLHRITTQRENSVFKTGTLPDIQDYLHSRKMQGESDGGLKYLVWDC